MTLRLDSQSKTLVLRLGRDETVFKIMGQTSWLQIPGHAEPVGIATPKSLYLEIRKARTEIPAGWRVLKGGKLA